MGDFTIGEGISSALEAGFVQGSNAGTTVLANGSADTKGAWTELLSAAGNTRNTHTISVLIGGNAANADYLFDIALGGAGSEVVLIPNLFTVSTSHSSRSTLVRFTFPLNIPAGARISARCQSNSGGQGQLVHVILSEGSFTSMSGLSSVIAYGADTANTLGVTVQSTTAGNFGAWTEITSSTTADIKSIVITGHRAGTQSWSNGDLNYELGIGSSGNEETILSGEQMSITSNENVFSKVSAPYGFNIPQGERLSLRTSSSVNNSDFDLDFVIYGAS